MPEVKIIRTQIVTIATVEKNTFGDLLFTDGGGAFYKISAKRVSYFEKVILPGVAVQLNYATAYNKEFIYSATQVVDGLPPSVKSPAVISVAPSLKPTPSPSVEKAKPGETNMSKEDWAEKDKVTRKSIERQNALREAVELAKIKSTDDTAKVIATAIQFEHYLETGAHILTVAKGFPQKTQTEGKEVEPAKSKLIETAQSLGAEIIPDDKEDKK